MSPSPPGLDNAGTYRNSESAERTRASRVIEGICQLQTKRAALNATLGCVKTLLPLNHKLKTSKLTA